MDAKTELTVKTQARRVYLWLLLSPFFTMPCLVWQGFSMSYQAGFGERLLAVAIPLVLHFPLLFWLASQPLFVRRHAQQGAILVLLRFLTAALILAGGRYIDSNFGWFLLVNGSLWFFGSLWGLRQVARGACSLMVWRGEEILLPDSRDIRTLKKELKMLEQAGLAEERRQLERAAAEGRLESAQNENRTAGRDQAVEDYVAAFRHGDRKTRNEALQALEELGEVEVF